MSESQMSERLEADLVEEAVVYISEKKYPDSCTANRKRQIRKRAEKFELRDGELYYRSGKSGQVSTILLRCVLINDLCKINDYYTDGKIYKGQGRSIKDHQVMPR